MGMTKAGREFPPLCAAPVAVWCLKANTVFTCSRAASVAVAVEALLPVVVHPLWSGGRRQRRAGPGAVRSVAPAGALTPRGLWGMCNNPLSQPGPGPGPKHRSRPHAQEPCRAPAPALPCGPSSSTALYLYTSNSSIPSPVTVPDTSSSTGHKQQRNREGCAALPPPRSPHWGETLTSKPQTPNPKP